MANPLPDGNRKPVSVKRKAEPAPSALRRGGSVTLPSDASPEDIENALRQPAAEEESK